MTFGFFGILQIMANILLVGEIMAEKQCFVNELPSERNVVFSDNIISLTSSKIINAGRILAVDNQVYMFGVVGEDLDGKNAMVDLKSYGIDTNHVYTISDSSTDQVLIFTDKNGVSAFLLHLSAGKKFDNTRLESFAGFDWICISTSMVLPQLYEVIARADGEGVKIFLDFPNQQKEFDKDKLRTVDIVVPNRQEAELLLDVRINSLQEAKSAACLLKSSTDGNVIITLDKDGCVAVASGWGQPRHFPVTAKKPVDETGSGDIMRGVLLNEYIKTNDLENSIEKAQQIASMSLDDVGVNSSIENTKERMVQVENVV